MPQSTHDALCHLEEPSRQLKSVTGGFAATTGVSRLRASMAAQLSLIYLIALVKIINMLG